MEKSINGRVWMFGDNIDTDVLAPGKGLNLEWEERKGFVLNIRPGFVDEVKPGDIIIAGKNWGCGSSREQAAENVKNLGVAAVVAESFGRIFFRNALAIALPAVVCEGVSTSFEEGDTMELDLKQSTIRNPSSGKELDCVPYTDDMLAMIEKGGILNVLKERLS
jgi:3-isopropylmalate dehydratase small subunit